MHLRKFFVCQFLHKKSPSDLSQNAAKNITLQSPEENIPSKLEEFAKMKRGNDLKCQTDNCGSLDGSKWRSWDIKEEGFLFQEVN